MLKFPLISWLVSPAEWVSPGSWMPAQGLRASSLTMEGLLTGSCVITYWRTHSLIFYRLTTQLCIPFISRYERKQTSSHFVFSTQFSNLKSQINTKLFSGHDESCITTPTPPHSADPAPCTPAPRYLIKPHLLLINSAPEYPSVFHPGCQTVVVSSCHYCLCKLDLIVKLIISETSKQVYIIFINTFFKVLRVFCFFPTSRLI